MTSKKVTVIVPALNEMLRLPRTLESVIEFLNRQSYTSEIIVVDDGSTDGTYQSAKSYQTKFPSLRVLSFKTNKGKGAAVKAAMLEASGRYRLFMDADSAVAIDYLEPFLNKCETGYDVVIGSRRHNQSRILERQRFPRHELAILFGYLQMLVLQIPFRDTYCGFKLYTAQAAETVFSQITSDCLFFDTESMYIAHRVGLKIFEHPVTWRHDHDTRQPIDPHKAVDLLRKLVLLPGVHSNIASETSKAGPR